MSYTKLSKDITTSTLWMEDDPTRIVWLTMLATKDRHGEIQSSVPGLAHTARVSVENCEKAIKKFLSPDPYSRTKDSEGRRLEEIDGGWAVINHEKYCNLCSDADRKAKNAERQRRCRERKVKKGQGVTNVTNVTSHKPSLQISHVDEDVDVPLDKKTNTGSAEGEIGVEVFTFQKAARPAR